MLGDEGTGQTTNQQLNESLIPIKQAEPREKSLCRRVAEILLFITLGVGSSFSLNDTVLGLFLPWTQDTQPEGLGLAVFLSICFIVQNLFVIFMGIVESYSGIRGGGKFVITLAFVHLGAWIFTAITWKWTIDDTSIPQLISASLGQIIGTLQFSVVYPWLYTNFEEHFVSAVCAGSQATTFIAVLLSVAQSPGDERRFGISIFCIIMAVPVGFAIISATYIVFRFPRIQPASLAEPRDSPGQRHPSLQADDLTTSQPGNAPISHIDTKKLESGETATGGHSLSMGAAGDDLLPRQDEFDDGAEVSYMQIVFPPFWRAALPYVVRYTWITIATWNVQQIWFPSATARTVPGNTCSQAGDLQQISTQLMDGCHLLGNLTSILASPGYFFINTSVFLQFIFLIPTVIAAADIDGIDWTPTGMQALLVVSFCMVRFTYGWCTPIIFRDMALRFPKVSETMGRHVTQWSFLISTPVASAIYILSKEGYISC